MAILKVLRDQYHRRIGEQIVRYTGSGKEAFPNFADAHSRSSVDISRRLAIALGYAQTQGKLDGQSAGSIFQTLTCQFVSAAFAAIQHLRPGRWERRTAETAISHFVQYQHLGELSALIKKDAKLATVLGHEYVIAPDIVVSRHPAKDTEINRGQEIVRATDAIAARTPFREANQAGSGGPRPFLHASISCKWTIRSDRSQNTRTEALNLMRHRKGPLPHIVAVTAEPLPMRIASLALGTGDLDCVYHFALPELREACLAADCGHDQLEMLDAMVEGSRLRDISDLPFDLAI